MGQAKLASEIPELGLQSPLVGEGSSPKKGGESRLAPAGSRVYTFLNMNSRGGAAFREKFIWTSSSYFSHAKEVPALIHRVSKFPKYSKGAVKMFKSL